MAKGTPNDSSVQLNFVAKVWDETAGDYRPIYIAPDATKTVRGDVYLSDAIDGTESADDKTGGVTAATPKAVKTVYDSAIKNNITTAQTMQSDLTPKTTNTLSLGTSTLKWANMWATTFHGALDGNANSASKLQTTRKFKITNGKINGNTAENITAEVPFDGTDDVNILLTSIDASTVKYNKLPLDVIPHGAMERLVKVADQVARFKLQKSDGSDAQAESNNYVSNGDSVLQLDTNTMYIVIDDTKLSSAAGYQEYAAGTAVQAQRLEPGATIQTALGSDAAVTFKGDSNVTPGVSGTLPVKHGGTGATTLAQHGIVVGNAANAVNVIGATATGAVYKTAAGNDPTIGTLPVAQGGTGITSNPSMIVNLGSTTADTVFQASPTPGISGTLDIDHGGTNATTADGAWTNLGGGNVGKLNTNGSSTQFLRGDGTWQTVSTDDNKTKQTNSTAATAYPILLKNGTGTGEITNGVLFNSAVTITPSTGLVTATTFKGTLDGNAATATKTATADAWTTSRTISLTGNVTGSASGVDGSSNISITTTLADGAATTAKLGSKAVTLAKLADEVQTVYVGSTQPTDSHVTIWIQP